MRQCSVVIPQRLETMKISGARVIYIEDFLRDGKMETQKSTLLPKNWE